MSETMDKIYKLCGVSFGLALAMLVSGCSQNDVSDGDDRQGGFEATSYVTLKFAVPSGSRSNPAGGEDGDVSECGQSKENEINSAVAFFYQDADNVNGNGDAQVTPIYFNNVDKAGASTYDATYIAGPQLVKLANGDYHVLVVANPGVDDWWNKSSLTLDEVRNHIQKSAWSKVGEEYSEFFMSSESDAGITLAANPQTSPAEVSVNVERMAARIDYKADGVFDCVDKSGSIRITGAAIVNDFTAGSYLLKRVADEVDGDVEYLGDETDNNGVGTNYVIDPLTAQKTSSNNTFTLDGGAVFESCAVLFGTYFSGTAKNTDPNYWNRLCIVGTELKDDNNDTWHRMGYTFENTTAAAESGYTYNTAVVFKAQYIPAEGTIEGDYTVGSTFFRYMRVLYASMEDLVNAFYGRDFEKIFNTEGCFDNISTYGDLAGVGGKYLEAVSVDPSGYKAFLDKEIKGHGTEEAISDKKSLIWSNYMLTNCGYKHNSGTVEVDCNGIQTRNILKQFGVNTYEDATCYYTWLVKHADNEDETIGKMEYGIVRNNIYKLTVNSVSSIGGDIPGENTDNNQILVRVKVNDWLMLQPEEIIM